MPDNGYIVLLCMIINKEDGKERGKYILCTYMVPPKKQPRPKRPLEVNRGSSLGVCVYPKRETCSPPQTMKVGFPPIPGARIPKQAERSKQLPTIEICDTATRTKGPLAAAISIIISISPPPRVAWKQTPDWRECRWMQMDGSATFVI